MREYIASVQRPTRKGPKLTRSWKHIDPLELDLGHLIIEARLGCVGLDFHNAICNINFPPKTAYAISMNIKAGENALIAAIDRDATRVLMPI